MELPTFDGKKANRMLFFLFISVTCVILAIAALLSISREGHDVLMILILAVITGVIACFYGIYWVYSILKQKFMDKYFSEEEEDGESGEEDERPACDISEGFVLPAENEKDLDEIDPNVRAKLRFVPVETVDAVFAEALVLPEPAGVKGLDTYIEQPERPRVPALRI